MNKDEIETAAEYICIQLYPDELKRDFVRDIRVCYHAEEIVYVLQALSTGMAGIFIGLVANYLYDKTKKSSHEKNNIEKLLIEQQQKLIELERLIEKEKEKDKDFFIITKKHFDTHKATLQLIQDSDPYIPELIRKALSELELRGQEAIDKEIDSHFD